MFRVLPNTVLSRLAAVGLLALTTGLAACGSDDAGNQAAVPAAPATTSDTAATTAVPASTPETTTPLTKAQKKAAAKALAKQQEALKSQAEKTVSKNIPTVTDTPETEKTIEDASARKRSKHRLSDDVDTAETALKKAGQDAKKVKVTGGASAAIQVQNTTVVFFSSDKKAATSAQTFTLALAANPDFGRISRTHNRVYLESSAQKLTPDDLAAFKTVRDIVDKAL